MRLEYPTANVDERILSVAKNLAEAGEHAVLVTRDLPMRLRASVLGLDADEYRTEFASDPGWTGVIELEIDAAEIDRLYADGELKLEEAHDAPVHTAFRLTAGGFGGMLSIADRRLRVGAPVTSRKKRGLANA